MEGNKVDKLITTDKLKLELLDVQGNDNTIANTARVSMQFNGAWDELPCDYTEEQRNKLISYLAKHKHTSPFRHNSITIRMTIPIFLARQLGKHQVGMSWNEVSRRYVDEQPTFYIPTTWRQAPKGSIKQGSGNKHYNNSQWSDDYTWYISSCLDIYETMLKDNVAPELARMVLPQSMMTQVVWTGSLMAFAHVYNLRIDSHSQVEAQVFAQQLSNLIEPSFPISWKELTKN